MTHDAAAAPGRTLSPSAPCRVAIVGFGTVGQSVARILIDRPRAGLRLTHICNRGVARKKVDWVPGDVRWTERFEDVLVPEVDVVVELIGGLLPAEDWIRRALDAGKSVVTANKQVIAVHGTELAQVAARAGRHLRYEAAVAGGIPVVYGLKDGLAGDRLFKVVGILNGTCNYILTRMEAAGQSFVTALAEAQKAGFAEADPSDDVEGRDARAKLAILTRIALRCQVTLADIPTRPITPIEPIDFIYAGRLGCTIRQISRAELVGADRRELVAWVQPVVIPRSSLLASVQGSQNMVIVAGESGGETGFYGFGAGGAPTAVAVVSDLVSIAKEGPAGGQGALADDLMTPVLGAFKAPYYLRLVVQDRPGIIAAVATVFARHGVSVDAVLQEPGTSRAERPFVVTLEPCETSALERALVEIGQLDFHARPPVALPIVAEGARPAPADSGARLLIPGEWVADV